MFVIGLIFQVHYIVLPVVKGLICYFMYHDQTIIYDGKLFSHLNYLPSYNLLFYRDVTFIIFHGRVSLCEDFSVT